MNGISGTHSYDEFVRPTTIRNEVRLYVRSEGEVLPIGMRPLYRQNEGAPEDRQDEHSLGIVDTTESSELIEDSFISPKRAWITT